MIARHTLPTAALLFTILLGPGTVSEWPPADATVMKQMRFMRPFDEVFLDVFASEAVMRSDGKLYRVVVALADRMTPQRELAFRELHYVDIESSAVIKAESSLGPKVVVRIWPKDGKTWGTAAVEDLHVTCERPTPNTALQADRAPRGR